MFVKYSAIFLGVFKANFALESKELEVKREEQVNRDHSLDSLSFLILIALLIAHVITVWAFSRKMIWYIHPTGLALAYGRLSFRFHLSLIRNYEYKCCCRTLQQVHEYDMQFDPLNQKFACSSITCSLEYLEKSNIICADRL